MRERIGTVDRFQGQEAPVVIYSMTSSSPEDAPRGMEFLYNRHRFNVATSRARALCVLVGNPSLFEPAYVFRRSGLRMKGHGVTTDDQVPNLVSVECGQEFFEV